MKTLIQRLSRLALLLIAPLALTACGINSIPTKEEKAKAQWAEVQNQYQRRSDLIPNLVATVKGYAASSSSLELQPLFHLVVHAADQAAPQL
eukprot:gene14775-19546_t